MDSKYTHRIVTSNRPNTEETGDFNGLLCSEHKSEASAVKAKGRLVAMSRSKDASRFTIEKVN